MDTDTCVGYVSKGPRKGLRCAKSGTQSVGIQQFKVCDEHSSVLFLYAQRHYPWPAWAADLISRGLKGRYDHA